MRILRGGNVGVLIMAEAWPHLKRVRLTVVPKTCGQRVMVASGLMAGWVVRADPGAGTRQVGGIQYLVQMLAVNHNILWETRVKVC